MIDLDQPPPSGIEPHGGSGRGWRWGRSTRLLSLVAVGCFLLGGVLAGAATYTWRDRQVQQEERAKRSVVSVLLFAESGARSMDPERRQGRIDAQVTVVNAGPEPLNVLTVRVDQPTLTVRSTEKERWIQPGTATPVDVVVKWNCVNDQPVVGFEASIRVETMDENVRDVSQVAIHGTPWIDGMIAGCASVG